MKKILVAEMKHGNLYFDASTDQIESNAYISIFKTFEENSYYFELSSKEYNKNIKQLEKELKELRESKTSNKEVKENINKKIANLVEEIGALKFNKELFDKAKNGDSKAAKQLIELRSEYEYERVRTDFLQE